MEIHGCSSYILEKIGSQPKTKYSGKKVLLQAKYAVRKIDLVFNNFVAQLTKYSPHLWTIVPCSFEVSLNETLCAIWYHLYNLKNIKNTHVGVLPLVKLQHEACNFNKSNIPPWVFLMFFKLYLSNIKTIK